MTGKKTFFQFRYLLWIRKVIFKTVHKEYKQTCRSDLNMPIQLMNFNRIEKMYKKEKHIRGGLGESSFKGYHCYNKCQSCLICRLFLAFLFKVSIYLLWFLWYQLNAKKGKNRHLRATVSMRTFYSILSCLLILSCWWFACLSSYLFS